ncbi:SAM-dependent methyltransferase [Polyangium sp. y55x31]|uniref:SAM-dependent methyltransferase n=1 Tax=Polyangium sp. y55x31 TaxID=3042688 RepID=UPI0024824BDA|nr:SAM-dependent methyltransferase [Polyangium sp. y55x31]MDI1482793.1 SAM-dependent methyltransferase [Polyangium sp. y55x31]
MIKEKGSLAVVGTGIRTVGQLTGDTIARLKTASKVFYLVADIVGEQVIKQIQPAAESLGRFYRLGRSRKEAYDAMVERILSAVRDGHRTCCAAYGHPGVFAFPTHEAVRRARAEGYEAIMLPAVSAEDCLFADLGVDPANPGCLSHEATRFVLYKKPVDPTSALILWQVGNFGDPTYQPQGNRGKWIHVLVDRLLEHYPENHEVTLYEAAVFINCPARIERLPLGKLVEAELTPATTLYVPPARRDELDDDTCGALSIRSEHLKR